MAAKAIGGRRGTAIYVHLGGDVVVAVREVIAVLDGRSVAASPVNQDLIARARLGGVQTSGTVPAPSRGAVAWVVTGGGVYPSGLSAATLARRMTHFEEHGDARRPQTQGRTRGLRV